MNRPIQVTNAFVPDRASFDRLVDRVWSSGQFTNNGMLNRELKEQLKSYLKLTNLELAANGTLALQVAVKALGLQGEVITTPYSYIATASSLVWEGCVPVFVDVDKTSWCLDPNLIEAAITERTTAIVGTHVYGHPCDVDRIQSIADRYGLKVIYDAAHAFGVKLNGQSLLNFGDCSTLSFHATKLFHTCEGGAVICKSPDVERQVFLMSRFGHIGEDDYVGVGINAKMSELHAAVGLSILPVIDDIIRARQVACAHYDELLARVLLGRPDRKTGVEYNFSYYPVAFSSHDEMKTVRAALIESEIVPRRYFHPSLNTLHFLNNIHQDCPTSERIAQTVLCLPLYAGLPPAVIEKVSKIVLGAVR